MIHLLNNYHAAEVPEDISDPALHWLNDIQKLVFTSEIQDPLGCGGDMIRLPPGTWEIVCTSKGITRDHAHEIVQWFEIAGQTGYRDYSFTDDLRYPFIDPLNSFISLLASKGCDLNKTYLIIKKL